MHDPFHADALAAPQLETPSRRGLLGKAVLTGIAAVPVLGVLNATANAAPAPVISASAKEAFQDIRSHENDHVAYLKSALGAAARPKPTFKNLTTPDFNSFVRASRLFEITGVGAYLGALPLIKSKDYVAAAGSIALIEGRHAGFLCVLAEKDVSTQAKTGQASAFDKPLTIQEVVSAVSPYIVSLNGGPAASFTAGDDVSILNFALLLEFLEAEYYNINVPKYFGGK